MHLLRLKGPAQDLLREDPALLAASAGGTRSSLERAEHALRLLNLLKTPAAPVQRPIDKSAVPSAVLFSALAVEVASFETVMTQRR